jgi:hypothetical protein
MRAAKLARKGKKYLFLRRMTRTKELMILKIAMQVAAIRKTKPDMLHVFLQELITEFKGYKLIQCRFNKSNYEHFVMTPEIQILIGGLMDKASEGIMLASICHMLQVDTLSELLSLIPTGMPDTDVLDALWRDQKTPAGLNLLDDFVLLDTVALANKRGLLHECIGVD